MLRYKFRSIEMLLVHMVGILAGIAVAITLFNGLYEYALEFVILGLICAQWREPEKP